MDFRWEILAGYGPLFATGLLTTIELTVIAIGAGLVLGVFFGLVSSSRDAPPPKSPPVAWALKILRGLTVAYVTFFRGTPLFVQILLVHFAVMPTLIHPDHGLLLSGEMAREFRQSHGAFFSGALALTLNAGAYISEIFRAGIQSIHLGQTQAAYSVGLTHPQAMRFVVLPQAFRRMMPALVNQGFVPRVGHRPGGTRAGRTHGGGGVFPLLGALSGHLGAVPRVDLGAVDAVQTTGSAGPPQRPLSLVAEQQQHNPFARFTT